MTLPQVVTNDPKTGVRNVGMYRVQVMGPDLLAMHWQRHKVGAAHWREMAELGEKMPVAIAIGGDPASVYSASAPLPPDIDEYIFAGFLRSKPVKLVKAVMSDLKVPAESDIVIEGYIDPAEDLVMEGPFGDHTGYYSLADYYPAVHVTAITMRDSPVIPTTIVGRPPMEDYYLGHATERIFLPLMRLTLPEIVDYHMPPAGVFHNLVFVSIDKQYPGHASKVMNALWGMGLMSPGEDNYCLRTRMWTFETQKRRGGLLLTISTPTGIPTSRWGRSTCWTMPRGLSLTGRRWESTQRRNGPKRGSRGSGRKRS